MAKSKSPKDRSPEVQVDPETREKARIAQANRSKKK